VSSSAPGLPLTYSASGLPAGASFNSSTGQFSWTPTEAQGPGTYPVRFKVSDGIFDASEDITITVNEVNAPPLAVNETFLRSPGAPVTGNVLSNDSDPDGDSLIAVRGTGSTFGTLTLNANGSFTYIPQAGTNYDDSFTYVVVDGHGGTATATAFLKLNT